VTRYLLLLACLPAAAQFRSDVRLVVIHASVTNHKGVPVKGLPTAAFRVFENGKLQPLKQAVREDVPVTLGILIDDSGSTGKIRPALIEAFLGMAAVLKPEDEMFVSHFSMFFSVDLPPTARSADLAAALSRLARQYAQQRYQTGTRLFDSLEQATDYLDRTSQRDKRVLLVITDGHDTTSLANLKQLLLHCRQTEDSIYAIGFGAGSDRKTLQQITAAAGGGAFFVRHLEDLPPLVLRIGEEIRSQYTLTYEPDAQIVEGSWRQLKVEIASPRGLLVRCRSGYFAGPRTDAIPIVR
jgi:VWFA-related protein